MEQTRKPYYPGLDLLRGVGALIVLLFHEVQPFAERTIFEHGYLAVDMFFMVSGYVLAARFEHELATRALSPIRYMVRRLRRVYPLLALGVVLGICAAASGAIACGPLGQEAVAHLLIIPTLTGGFLFALNPALWSLFAELWTNLAHALIAPLLTTRRLALLVALMGMGLAAGISVHASANLGSSMDTAALGLVRAGFGFLVGIACWRREADGDDGRWGQYGCALLFVLVVLGAELVDDRRGLVDMAAILTFPVILRRAARVRVDDRGARIATQAARMSYPLYAVHYPLVFVARSIIDPAAPSPGPFLAYALVTLLIVLLAGLLATVPRIVAASGPRRSDMLGAWLERR